MLAAAKHRTVGVQNVREARSDCLQRHDLKEYEN